MAIAPADGRYMERSVIPGSCAGRPNLRQGERAFVRLAEQKQRLASYADAELDMDEPLS